MIRFVFFDLDGTLLRDDHSDGVVRRVAADLGSQYGVDPDALAEANRREWIAYWPEAGERWMAGEFTPDHLPREVWGRALAGLGVTDARAVEQALALHWEYEHATFELYPESLGALAKLAEQGIGTGIITNGPTQLQRAKLAASGLDGVVDVVIVSEEVGATKPDPAIFAEALRRAGVPASEAVHVGDNQTADVVGAKAAGLGAVWINRVGGERVSEPDAVVTELDALVAYVGERAV